MKTAKRMGVILLCIAVALLATGVIGASLPGGTGALSGALQTAQTHSTARDALIRARDRLAPSAVKKAETALKGAQTASEAVQAAQEEINGLISLYESGAMNHEVIDALRAHGESEISDRMTMELFTGVYNKAAKAVTDAEGKLIAAMEGIAAARKSAGISGDTPACEKTKTDTPATPQAAVQGVSALAERARFLSEQAQQTLLDAQQTLQTTATLSQSDALTLADRALLLVSGRFIGVLFTGFTLLLAALILLLAAPAFARAWKTVPSLSTFTALIALMVIQAYALGFDFPTVGQWLTYWFNNVINVLRANSSVGMIALGMTLVIITGGIDLAVGSTLAGVATVVMVLLDVSSNGALTGAGVTGLPNYLIAILSGLLVGTGVGALIGLGVTKGRIPPFIITLGVMNIVRSVAQYFTKSYKTEVPKDFQALANLEIGGQMLLPILYWLILAVIMYVITKHTAFGRHIYAVGSNERTSRLSGINVDRVKLCVYMLMGFIVAIAAVTQVARLRGVDVASAGSGYEMNAIAAVVVGGTSMAGGRGTITGTVLGVLIIGIMNNLLVLLGIDAFLADAFTGLIIIGAVLMQRKQK